MGFGVFPPGRLHVKKHLAGKAARRSGVSCPHRIHGRKGSHFPAGRLRGRGDGGAGWGVHLPTPTHGRPRPRRQRERAGGRRRPSPGAHEVAAGEVPAPFVAQLFPQHWSRRVQCRKPPLSPSPAFLSSQGDTANPFVTPVTFPPWQQGRGAPTGEASPRAQPPAASTAALSSTALRRTESTHSRGRRAARETTLWDNLNAHGESVPLFGSPCHQSQPGQKGRKVKCRHFWPCPPVQVVHSPWDLPALHLTPEALL